MGWTEYHASCYKNGKIDRKAECDALFNDDMVLDHKIIGKFEVLKSSMVGSTYYAAVKRTRFATETEPEKSCVFAAVCLTSTNMKDYYNFAYKDMDETCGPCNYDCPKKILDLLTPTDSEYAKNWREKCYEKLKNKQDKNSLSKLPIGSVIKFQNGRREITLCKHPAGYQFKRPFWILNDGSGYIPQKYIPDDFIVVKKGD